MAAQTKYLINQLSRATSLLLAVLLCASISLAPASVVHGPAHCNDALGVEDCDCGCDAASTCKDETFCIWCVSELPSATAAQETISPDFFKRLPVAVSSSPVFPAHGFGASPLYGDRAGPPETASVSFHISSTVLRI